MEGATIADVRPATGPVPDVILVPGFVDLQVNGIGTVDVAHAAEERLEHASTRPSWPRASPRGARRS